MKVYVGAPPNAPVGTSIPYGMPHGVSVSLPTWKDNVDYEEGHPRIAAAMSSGYPRFYIHHQIDQLARLITLKFGQDGELCILCPSAKTAASCQTFLAARSVQCRLIQYPIRSTDSHSPLELPQPERVIVIHAALFPAASFSTAKQFWQHTGDGISSRTAERCLTMLGAIVPRESEGTDMTTSKSNRGQARNRHYAAKAISTSAPAPPFISSEVILPPKSKSRYATRQPSASSTDSQIASSIFITATPTDPATPVADEEEYLTRYVEERYGRNLDLSLAPLAKLAMRRRLAGVLGESGSPSPLASPKLNGGVGSSGSETQGEESIRGVAGLTENDVWLYSCGMSAIFHAHQLAMGTRTRIGGEQGKSVCFGFPYTDTLKILEKWGPGVHFFGNGLSDDLPALRTLLTSASPPILALFCEFPSNPLLRTPPLRELRELANEFGFMIIIDETIAGFVNVEVLPLADIVVSSLTKVFSGDSNVMGGSLVINPASPYYDQLKLEQDSTYEDCYFDEDAIYMERNSRDFQDRIVRENENAEILCDLLRTRRAPGPTASGMIPAPPSSASDTTQPQRPYVLKEVYYPKYMTPAHYLCCMRPPNPLTPTSPGFGGLFSLTFTSLLASTTFYDALPCYKGPSLGTNFTLACPYTILAHYEEEDWAKGWGVERGLVRVSTGLEEGPMLKEWFESALDAAEKAVESFEQSQLSR